MNGVADVDVQTIAEQQYRAPAGAEGYDPAAAAGDSRLFIEFRKEWSGHPNKEKSAEAGRPVFDEVEYLRIYAPGDRNNVVDCPVNETHRARFAAQYQRWLNGLQGEAKDGTPIEKWPECTRGDVESLKYLHVYTVEQLCTLDDNVLIRNPGLREMQKRARQWIDVATRNAAASQLRAEKEKAEQANAALQNQLAEQAKRLAQLEERLLKGK